MLYSAKMKYISVSLLAVLLVNTSVFANEQTCADVMDVTLEIPTDECNICMVGCAPYVSGSNGPYDNWLGVLDEMKDHCALMVHVGDTIPGSWVCNKTILEKPLNDFKAAAADAGIPALYTIGDNECNDCHRRFAKSSDASYHEAADFYKAEDARDWAINKYFSDTSTDLTGQEAVETPTAECPFNVYVKKCNAAVVTLEVPGTYWYMGDESKAYPQQYTVDPFEGADGRISMYNRAKQCTLDMIDSAMQKANDDPDVHAVLFFYHASFWTSESANEGSSDTYGDVLYTKGGNMPDSSRWPWFNVTTEAHEALNGGQNPYKPLADKLLAVADQFPDLTIYTGHADHHYFRVQSPQQKQNFFNVMTEGGKPAMTAYTKFQIRDDPVNPVTATDVRVKTDA